VHCCFDRSSNNLCYLYSDLSSIIPDSSRNCDPEQEKGAVSLKLFLTFHHRSNLVMLSRIALNCLHKEWQESNVGRCILTCNVHIIIEKNF
ncbi:hypothetical protein PENTCL1PPCAC_21034, partial [Pristionchus entomophagus]